MPASGTAPTPRVRFAPSPTGYLHVGSARTALFNWLFARGSGGTFILRIEDTDTERNREEWAQGILTSLEWLGMEPDEGPYRQSERGPLYQAAIDALWTGGFLYACDCTKEDVAARTKGNATPGYDGHCRDRSLERGPGRALRFRTPDAGETTVVDVIRGDVSFPHAAMEDFVCVKSDGGPLFVLANVVDDRDMAITHVIRGDDLLPSSPKGVLLWRALDTATSESRPLPVFAHLPMLVDEQRKKLGKRWESVAVEAFREQGYLADAFRNYLALLGWSPPGDQEKVPLDVLTGTFRLEDVHHAPAFFDVAKCTHLNGEYIRELPTPDFIDACRPWVDPSASGGAWTPAASPPWTPDRFDPETFARLAPVVQERVATLGEVPRMVDFVFLADPPIDDGDWRKAVAGDAEARALLRAAIDAYRSCEWTSAELHRVTLELAEAAGRKLGKAQAPIRVAITGRRVGPPLFEALEVMGRDEVLRRLQAALDRVADGGTSPPPA